MPTKTQQKKAGPGKPNGLQKPLQPSAAAPREKCGRAQGPFESMPQRPWPGSSRHAAARGRHGQIVIKVFNFARTSCAIVGGSAAPA